MAEFYPPGHPRAEQAAQQQKADFDAFVQAVYAQGATDARNQQAAQTPQQREQPQQPVRYTADQRNFPSFFLSEQMKNNGRNKTAAGSVLGGAYNELFGGDTPIAGLNKQKPAYLELFGNSGLR